MCVCAYINAKTLFFSLLFVLAFATALLLGLYSEEEEEQEEEEEEEEEKEEKERRELFYNKCIKFHVGIIYSLTKSQNFPPARVENKNSQI